jgi:transposase
MSKQRRSFSVEFKHDAAALVVDQGYSVAEACKSMGVGETAIRRWVDQLREERGGVTPNSKALTAEQQEIQALKARINRLELEKKILKEATALLMAEEHGRRR